MPHYPGQTVYWMNARPMLAHSLLTKLMFMSIDYDIMHRHFAHPSMDVLQHASGNLQGFPSILIPKENPNCPGCTLGKMTSLSFPATDKHATMLFDKVHMDLKAMPIRSFYRYNYFIILFDTNTSHGWTVNLKKKSDADPAIRQFIAKIKTQYGKQIREFQIDAGGEFKSWELTEFLKELAVNILTSVPHMHQQNGHAEVLSGQLWKRPRLYIWNHAFPSPGGNSLWIVLSKFTIVPLSSDKTGCHLLKNWSTRNLM